MVEYKVEVYKTFTIWKNLDGKRHRTDGPAIEHVTGTKEWYLKGKLHREDGPAVEYANGTKEWYLKGKLHREDGPAVEYANGTKYWYLKGKRLTEKEFNKRLKSDPCDGKVIEIEGKKYKLVKEKN